MVAAASVMAQFGSGNADSFSKPVPRRQAETPANVPSWGVAPLTGRRSVGHTANETVFAMGAFLILQSSGAAPPRAGCSNDARQAAVANADGIACRWQTRILHQSFPILIQIAIHRLGGQVSCKFQLCNAGAAHSVLHCKNFPSAGQARAAFVVDPYVPRGFLDRNL